MPGPSRANGLAEERAEPHRDGLTRKASGTFWKRPLGWGREISVRPFPCGNKILLLMKGCAFLHSSPLSSTSFISAWHPDSNSVIDDTRETIWAKQKGLLSSRDEWRLFAAYFLTADKISGSLMLWDFLWLVCFFASFMTPSFLSCLWVHRTCHSSLSLRQGSLSPGCPQGCLVLASEWRPGWGGGVTSPWLQSVPLQF